MTSQMNDAGQRDLEYAGFWIRVVASIIDSFLYLLLLIPLLALTMGDMRWSSVQSGDAYSGQFSLETLQLSSQSNVIFNYLLPAIIVFIFWQYKSATPGKMAFRLRIVDAKSGEKPSNSKLIIRYLGYYLSGIVFLLGFIWVAFDARKQGWHDKLAGTVVVRSKHPKAVEFES